MTKRERDQEADPGPEAATPAAEESFGSWLRRQRELREISLREIADTSKISLRYLEALEDERFDLLPAQIFAKGFLRQYARYVGIDPEETVNFFLSASQPAEEPPEVVEVPERARRKRLTGWFYLAAALAAAAVLFLALWGLMRLNERARGETGSPPSPAAESPAADIPAVAPPPSGDESSGSAAPDATPPGNTVTGTMPHDGTPPTAEPSSPRTAPTAAALVVTLDFHKDCWVEAAADGQRRVAEIRVQGESLRLEAEKLLEIKLGDAGAVDVEVNGYPLSRDAREGAVETLRIDLETARRLARSGVG